MKFRRKKPARVVECGGFIVKFYLDEYKMAGNYADITTISDNFRLRVTDYTFGYLYQSALQDKVDNIHGFCALVYIVADDVYKDKGLADDLIRIIGKYQRRLDAKAQAAAKEVTPDNLTEDEIILQEAMRYGLMAEEERLRSKEEMRDILRESGVFESFKEQS